MTSQRTAREQFRDYAITGAAFVSGVLVGAPFLFLLASPFFVSWYQ